MACLSCVRKSRVSDLDPCDPVTGLTKSEERLVQTSWPSINKDWTNKHGTKFFVRLFQKHPRIKSYFPMFDQMSQEEMGQSAELCSHAIDFSNVKSALAANLDKPEVITGAIHKLAKSHCYRGITPDLKAFTLKALSEFVDFISDSQHASRAEVTAWRKTTAVVASVIRNHTTDLKARSS